MAVQVGLPKQDSWWNLSYSSILNIIPRVHVTITKNKYDWLEDLNQFHWKWSPMGMTHLLQTHKTHKIKCTPPPLQRLTILAYLCSVQDICTDISIFWHQVKRLTTFGQIKVGVGVRDRDKHWSCLSHYLYEMKTMWTCYSKLNVCTFMKYWNTGVEM